MFGKKEIQQKELNSKEWVELDLRLLKISSALELLKSEFEALRTNQNSLRGLVNRKFDINPTVIEVEEKPKDETNKYSVFLG